jgi:LCP family protein required for cell wall assembly
LTARPRPILRLAFVLAVAIAGAGCGSSASLDPTAPTSPAVSNAPSPTEAPTPTAEPTPSPAPTPSPEPSPDAAALGGERLTVLVIGLDTLAGRTRTIQSDAMLIASIDPAYPSASMLSLPRDMTDVVLPDGAIYRRKLGNLYQAVSLDPGAYAGAEAGPERFLADTLEATLDIEIDHWVAIDMDGFADVIDALGGVDVAVRDGFCDPTYRGLGLSGFEIGAGTYHFDGAEALAFARVRKAEGESDFRRMFRQQDLLVAIGEALRDGAGTDDPLDLLAAVGGAVRTDMPPETIVAAARAGAAIERELIYSRVVQPVQFVTEAIDDRGYVLIPDLPELREYTGYLFGEPGVRPKTGPPDEVAIAPPSPGRDVPAFGGC